MRGSPKMWLWTIGVTLAAPVTSRIVGGNSHEATVVRAMDEVMNLCPMGGWTATVLVGLVCAAALMMALLNWNDNRQAPWRRLCIGIV